MKQYICKSCKFTTYHKSEFDRHLLTQKHLKNSLSNGIIRDVELPIISSSSIISEIEKFECSDCRISFPTEKLLNKHTGICPVSLQLKMLKKDMENMALEKDKVILKLEKELEVTKKTLELKDKFHDDLNTIKDEAHEFKIEALEANSLHIDKENDYHKNLLTTSMDKQTKIATSAIKLLQQHFPNAPRLEAPKEYDSFWEETDYGEREFMFTLSTWTANRSLHEHVGEKILKFIKKKDPSQQSAWALDPSRLNCAEMEDDWITDKKGDNLKEKIIQPFVDDLKERVRKIQQSGKLDVNEMTGKAMTLIHSPKFIRQILTYVCARIHIDREGRLKGGKNEGRFITYVEKDDEKEEEKEETPKKEIKSVQQKDDSETDTNDSPYTEPFGFRDSDSDTIACYKQSPKTRKEPKKEKPKKKSPKKTTKKEPPKKKSITDTDNYHPEKDVYKNDPTMHLRADETDTETVSPIRPYTKEEEAHLKKWVEDRKKGIGYKDEEDEGKEIVIIDKKPKKASKEKSKEKPKKKVKKV
jgi:hypothetical protein